MLKKLQLSLAGTGIAALAVFGVSLPASAHEGHDHTTTTTAETTTSAKERVKGRLDEAKKRVCENRVENIKKIMQKAATAGQRHLELFSKTQTRVEEFYASKKLTVANYAELLAATNSKKQTAQTAVDAVKNNVKFECGGDSPVGNIDAFNGQVRAMQVALKDYRGAINNLLVAVKNAAKGTE